jgi:hypothetical protein
MPTYGLPFDMVAMMLQRCMPMPSQTRRNLYSHMRCALLDDSMNRCVVFCHDDSAVLVSQAVTQLCADLPSEKLAKLEIYTFGAAASEFVMPLRDSNMEWDPAQQSPDQTNERRGVHVEHFALTSDPFAQMGVLQSVRQNMDGHFCGSVFIMNDDKTPTPTSQTSTHLKRMPACSGLSMEDYLTALFPSQMTPGTTSTTPRSSVLDSVVAVDRDCAEKREIAAMSNYHAAVAGQEGREAPELDRAGGHGGAEERRQRGHGRPRDGAQGMQELRRSQGARDYVVNEVCGCGGEAGW